MSAVPPDDQSHDGGVPSVDSLKLTVERRVEISGMIAEIRTYDWSRAERFVATSDHICFTHMLVSDHGPKPVQWKIPGSKRFITVGPVGIAPARTPVEVRRQPDEVRSFLLRVEPGTFHRLTGLETDWYDEKLMLRLNKEGFAIVRLLGEIADELMLPGYASSALIESLATTFLVRFSRLVRTEGEKSGSGLSTWQLNRVRELVESRPANQVDIGLLAQACGISSRHLMRGFKAATGMTAHQYIQQIRVERTKRLLGATKMPLEAVAAAVGFASASHLSNAFLKELGIPPSVFRQQSSRDLRDGFLTG